MNERRMNSNELRRSFATIKGYATTLATNNRFHFNSTLFLTLSLSPASRENRQEEKE